MAATTRDLQFTPSQCFANPFIEDEPDIFGEGVLAIEPGEEVPTEGNWQTLYFMPGIHHVGLNFRLHSNRSYYIPGDAVVYGTLNNGEQHHNNDGYNIRIFGHGTLSGDLLPHPNYANPPIGYEEFWTYRPINIQHAVNVTVEGITIANSAYHSLSVADFEITDRPTYIRWVKIFTWKANGDGISTKKNNLIEDCFLRTQDDAVYVNGRGMRRVVFWNDANGSTFYLKPVGGEFIESHDLVIEDCTVVYARRMLPRAGSGGGRVFNMRGHGAGQGGSRLIFRNIVIEDPRPTMQQFFILMEGLEPYFDPEERRDPGDLNGILFQNITIVAASNVMKEPEILWGFNEGNIRNLTFDNVVIGGQLLDSQDFFLTNEYVQDLKFKS